MSVCKYRLRLRIFPLIKRFTHGFTLRLGVWRKASRGQSTRRVTSRYVTLRRCLRCPVSVAYPEKTNNV